MKKLLIALLTLLVLLSGCVPKDEESKQKQ